MQNRCVENLRFFANFSGRLSTISRPDANGFVTGPLVARRWNTYAGISSKYGRKTQEESRRKEFARQTEPLAIECKYRHCPISMPVVDTFLPYQKNGVIGGDSTVAVAKFVPESCPGNKVTA